MAESLRWLKKVRPRSTKSHLLKFSLTNFRVSFWRRRGNIKFDRLFPWEIFRNVYHTSKCISFCSFFHYVACSLPAGRRFTLLTKIWKNWVVFYLDTLSFIVGKYGVTKSHFSVCRENSWNHSERTYVFTFLPFVLYHTNLIHTYKTYLLASSLHDQPQSWYKT